MIKPAGLVHAAAIALLLWLPMAHIWAQESTSPADAPASIVEASDDAMFDDAPPDLPGHPRGPRTQPDTAGAPQDGEAEAGEPSAPPAPGEIDAPSDPETGASLEESPEPVLDEWFGGAPWGQWSRATGDWGGARTALEDAGLTLAGSYTMDWFGVVSGGLNRRGSYRHLLDVNATLDLNAAFGVEGGTAYIDFYSITGRPITNDTGDYFWISNIDAGESIDQIAELWYEQVLFDGVLRLKAGKVDASYEFGYTDAGFEAVNSAAAMEPTIVGFPTYPDPATAVIAFVYPIESLYAGFGYFDGATAEGFRTGGRGPATFFSDDDADSEFLIGEAGVSWDRLLVLGKGRLAAGGWHHTARFDRFDGGTERGVSGAYLVGQARVWTPADATDEEDARGLDVFVQVGGTDEEVSDVEFHLGGGATLVGTFAGRDSDTMGVYVSWLNFSDEAGAGFDEDEVTLELFYGISVTPWVLVKPDLQVVFNPSGDAGTGDAVALGVRVEVSF